MTLEMAFSCSSGGMQSGRPVPSSSYWDNTNEITYNEFSNFDQIKLQEDFHQRISGQEQATCNSLSFQADTQPVHAVSTRTTGESANDGVNLGSADPSAILERQYASQRKWLLILYHARCCKAPEGTCIEQCINLQELLNHMDTCRNVMTRCNYPRCTATQVLINHYKQCKNTDCPVCVPVKGFLERQSKARTDSSSHLGVPNLVINDGSLDLKSSFKRIKVEKPFQSPPVPTSGGSLSIPVPPTIGQSFVSRFVHQRNNSFCAPMKPELTEVKMEITSDMNNDNIESAYKQKPVNERPSTPGGPDYCKKENVKMRSLYNSHLHPGVPHSVNDVPCLDSKTSLKHIKEENPFQPPLGATIGQSRQRYQTSDPSCTLMKPEPSKVRLGNKRDLNKDDSIGTYNQKPAKELPSTSGGQNTKSEMDADQNKTEYLIQNAPGTKSERQKIKGVSLTELFTPDQVREHIRGLRQWVGQSKIKVEKVQAMENSMNQNSCQLCAVEKLSFEPPPIYCTSCAARIKKNAMYFGFGAGETQQYVCIPCYNLARGDYILIDGTRIPKSKLGKKKKNDEETDEPWVQCDKCEAWQHQICALFNGRKNDAGQAEYTCPYCYIAEVERGEREPLPQSAVLGAKDLPRTILSDHIEQRLFKRLKEERQDRARIQGKSFHEVPGAEELVVRVVASVDKRLEVKERFLEIFRGERYPTEFPYKSKVVLLFQKIEGVEVCLFAMYVQEFGSECQEPNQRRVYLSYLDSVKYFRPEIKAATGEALRTLVYHEILIGYLEYCKRRGFVSCYIWACPPLKGEDYIIYCHPEIQKTPKSDKLREWYMCMLKKALKEDIVVDLTNLYDHFFVSTRDCKVKVTATRLPYFDGDYWPGAAEDMLFQLSQEEIDRRQPKKGTNKKPMSKRALKASGHSVVSGNVSKDLLLMHKLGGIISPMKEDFIMVHLQHVCSLCCVVMVSGNRWVRKQCKNFQLCDKCYKGEDILEEKEKHPSNQWDQHAFYQVVIDDVPEDTKDKDDVLESEFFDTRQTFLSLCQGNRYQYDTLRRAKHSSMMVLYHLHNPTAPAFVATCNVCHQDAEAGRSWRCGICPDFDVCSNCYEKNRGNNHPHNLTNYSAMGGNDAQSEEARKMRKLQLRKMLDLLMHSAGCKTPGCQYLKCQQVKNLFAHGRSCQVRASGGCVHCKKMWFLLQFHARACKDSSCTVPRCSDLKKHFRRTEQQNDSRRRAAMNEKMRQRAAEVAAEVE